MTYTTNTVQGFIRSVVFVVTLLVTLGVLVVPLSALSQSLFGTGLVFAIPSGLFSLWFSSVISKMFYILPEWEKAVILRLGKFDGVRGAGFFIVPPFIYSAAAIVDNRIETHQVEATATLTKDNVPTKVTAAVEYKVEDPRKAVIDVLDYRSSVTWLSTEALKNTIGSMDLKELLSEREQIAESLKIQIDEGAAVYGIDVRAVRITDIDTPQNLVEELAVIARARRAAEAKRIQAEAEVEVANKTAEASDILAKSPNSLKLRELQVLTEISKEGGMIVVYPFGDTEGKAIAGATASNIKEKHTGIKSDHIQF